MDPLVSTHWLAERLTRVRVIDASYYLPEHARDARAEFVAAHIPGAAFLDLATLVDPVSDLPNTLPPASDVADRLGLLGVGADEEIVLYDASPLRSAARAWWMLRTAGIGNVALLDGGFAKWRIEGHATMGGDATHASAIHAAGAPLAAATSFEAMRDLVERGDTQVVDARSPARFAGLQQETRPEVKAGHMPGARNLHYATLFEADGTWKRGDALARAFADAGVNLDRPAVATCGSGVTAATLVFGAHLLGRTWGLYDGSWAEWGAHPDTIKALGTTAA